MTNHLNDITRRKFIGSSSMAMLAMPLYGQTVVGANERVRVALIGCGGKAGSHLGQFMKIPGVEIVAVCDPDTQRMDRFAAKTQAGEHPPPAPDKIRDYRKVLARKDVDAVVLSTPNHWHALQAIHALQAGKHVYVEKPVSHDLWEGQQLVAAARRHGLVVQAGYQNRSDPACIDGIRFVQEGNLGKILSVHVCCFRNRDTIGKQDAPLQPPASVDYDLWLGPAQDLPMHRTKFHYDWHWVFNTGNGDIGNQAPHEIDLACWVLGDSLLPKSIRSFGNRFSWNDAGNTPNMISASYEQAGVPVIIEVNDLKLSPERNAATVRDGVRVGVIVRCENGELRGGRGGMYVVGEDGKTRTHKFPGNGGRDHQKNFVDAVRSGDGSALNSQIEKAERSAAIAHLANTSFLSGGKVGTEELGKAIQTNEGLQDIVKNQAVHLGNWGIDEPSYILGKTLDIDPDTARVKTPGVDERLIRKPGRGEFVVPEIG